MILLTRLGGAEFVLNADHILFVERTPDTTLTLTGGARLMVAEPVEAVVARVIAFRRRILHGPEIVESPPESER
jgi:flagellar protein FlbD